MINKPKNAQKIINIDLSSFRETDYLKPNIARVLLPIFFLIMSLSVSIYLYFINSKKTGNQGLLSVKFMGFNFLAMLVFVTLTILFFTDIVLIVMIKYYGNIEHRNNFRSIFISKNRILINLLIIVMFFWLLIAKNIFDVGTYFKDNTQKKLDNYFIFGFLMIFMTTVYRGIIQFSSYTTHLKNFKDKIFYNDRSIKIIKTLNKMTKKTGFKDLKSFAAHIFSIISSGKPEICLDDLKAFFKDDAKEVFSIFDIDHDEFVTKEEFIHTYLSVIKERIQIKKSLMSKKDNIYKLKIITSTLLFLLFLICSLFISKPEIKSSSYFKTIPAFLLTMHFIFGRLLSEVFESAIFSFFIRPFEVGDIVILNGKTYRVEGFGILYITFKSDEKEIIMPNSSVRTSSITNIKKLQYKMEKYNLRLDYESSKDKLEVFKEKISKFLTLNKKIYSEAFDFSDISFENYDTINISIAIRIELYYDSNKIYNTRKDTFTLFLRDLCDELGFIQK